MLKPGVIYRLIFWFLSIFLTVTNLLGQSASVIRSDSLRVFNNLKKADYYLDRSLPDSALLFARSALDYARVKSYHFGINWSLAKLGDSYVLGDSLDEAYQNANQLYTVGAKAKDSVLIAISYLHKAQVKLYKDDYDSSIYWFEKSLKGNHFNKKKEYLALAFNDLGYTWGRKEELEKMTDYCLRSLRIYEELGKPAGSAMALGNISTMYFDMGNRAKALEYGRQSLLYREKANDINKLALGCCNFTQLLLGTDTNEIKKYATLCEKYALESGDESRIVQSYITLSVVKNSQRKNYEAFQYELKAIELYEKNQSDLNMLARRYIAAAFYSSDLKRDSSETIEYFNKSINVSRKTGSKKNLRDVYAYLSDFYRRQNDYEKALSSYKLSVAYKDSINLVERSSNIAELEAKYQTAKKDAEIDKLNYQEELRKLEMEKQKALLVGNQLLAREKQAQIELIGKQREIKEAALKQQEEELIRGRLLASNKEQEYLVSVQQQKINEEKTIAARQLKIAGLIGLGLLLAMLTLAFSRFRLRRQLVYRRSMQTMRNTIASDLHDDVGASLSNINILNELTRRSIHQPEKVKEYLGRTAEDIRQVSEGIGDIIWSINPIHDQMDQLLIRMKRYASDLMDAKNIQYSIEFSPDLSQWKLSMDKRRDLYLFFKEAVNNLVKYSKTKEARIAIMLYDQYVQVDVIDYGIGFELGNIKPGNGLQNMEHRANSLGGELKIMSSKGKGTQLQLQIPIRD